MKKFILFTSFFGFLLTSTPLAWAMQNVLQDLSYSQRSDTKLVDLNYRLNLEIGQTAEVTFTFSHDNGSTFPVICRSITGDIGKGLTSGYKSAVWDAGVDWPLQFTDLGRIKATCLVMGEEPPPDDGRKPLAFEVVSVPLTSSKIIHSPAWSLNKWWEEGIQIGECSKRAKGYKVAKYEVTNHQWNVVAEWSASHGYDLQQVTYSPGKGNLPRTNVAIKEVLKWLNALSEKEGLTPRYYLDPFEPRCDQNGDGKYSVGGDSWFGGEKEGDHDYSWDPNFDWTIIPNGKKHLTGGWIEFDRNYNGEWDEGEPYYDRNRNKIFDVGIDSIWGGEEEGDWDYEWDPNFDWTLIPNGKESMQGGWIESDPNYNGIWDPGEPFYDRNRNGKFEPREFYDFNNNGKVDDGLTEVYRTGDISSIEKYLGGFSLRLHQELDSNGYALPISEWRFSESQFLAMGDRENSVWGEYWDYSNPGSPHEGPIQGLIFKDEWHWGEESPDEMPHIDEYAITPFGKFSTPQSVGLTKANDYGIYDMIGNVREYVGHWEKGRAEWNGGHQEPMKEVMASGGSVSNGFEKVETWDPDDYEPNWEIVPSQVMAPLAEDWYNPVGEINPASPDGNPDVGFRPIRWTF